MRLIVGADEAGIDYKDRILKDLQADPRVSEVISPSLTLMSVSLPVN
jgi:hypothetical protein